MDKRIARIFSERDSWLEDIADLKVATRRQTIRDLEDAGNREDMTRRDYAGRYPLELLQNAHDACADAGRSGRTAITVTRNALLFANEGRPFGARRLRSLVRQGASEKAERARRRTIGYKGVGFSSVFEITKTPQIITSQGYAFGFDRRLACAAVEKQLRIRPGSVAARNFPFLLDPEDWDDDGDVVQGLIDAGYVTVVRLPFNRSVSAGTVMHHCWNQLEPQTLALMPFLSRLEYADYEGDRRTFESKRGARVKGGAVVHVSDETGESRSWVMRRGEVPIEHQTIQRLEDPSWEGVVALGVTVGLPWAERAVDPAAAADHVYVYFQTAETTGRSCLIHADFYVDSRRSAVMTDGAAGEINEAASKKAAEMLAEMAAAMTPAHGGRPLSALAEIDTPSGFGEVVGGHLCEALSRAKVVRCAASKSRVAKPSQLKRIAEGAISQEHRDLLRLVGRKSDLIRPQDFVDERAAQVLDELDVPVLADEEMARRISVARSGLPYEKALSLVGAWLHQASDEANAVLRDRKILMTTDKKWCTPRKAMMSAEAFPPLPRALGIREVHRVRSAGAADLLEQLEIQSLDREGVFGLLSEGLDAGTLAFDAASKRALHDWLWRLWLQDPPETHTSPALGRGAPVFVRSANGGRPKWRPAGEAYFGKEWGQSGERLETIFGPDELFEFLVARPPRKVSEARIKRFYRWLGVRERPWAIGLDDHQDSFAAFDEWLELPEVARAANCPDGHFVDQRLTCSVWERLDDVLARARRSQLVAAALLELLNELDAPYGEDGTFTCTHSHHRGRARARPVVGYQRWRLRETEWVLVTNDPGPRKRRAPRHIWTGTLRSRTAADLLVPRSRLPASERLEFIPWGDPPPESVEAALDDLRRANRDLARAPKRSTETADRLLKKLQTALGKETSREARTGWLPAEKDGKAVWAKRPLVLDIPGLESVPGAETIQIDAGSSLRAAYELPLASEVIERSVRPGRPRSADPILGDDRRAQLLVLLERKGIDTATVAQRIARLKESHVSRIDVELRLPGAELPSVEDHPFAIQAVPASEPPTLFLTPEWISHQRSVGSALAAYLDVSGADELITLVLAAPSAIADDISEGELNEALDLLHDRGLPGQDVEFRPEEEQESDVAGENGDLQKASSEDRGGATSGAPRRGSQSSDSTRTEALAASPQARGSRAAGEERLELPRPADIVFEPPRAVGPDRADSGSPRAEQEKPRHSIATKDERGDEYPVPPSTQSQSKENDQRVERFAVEYVEEYAYRELGVEQVVDRQADRCGWDLEFIYGDRVRELVEVKGSRSDASFEITANELEKSREHENWILYFLANQAEAPILYRFAGFGALAARPHLQARSWAVTGWRSLSPEVIEIRTR